MPLQMEKLFNSVLEHGLDPRPQINELMPVLTKWAYSLQDYKDTGYNRNVVCKWDETNEIVLASWKKNQKTPFHFHTDQSCWIYMFKGTLEEVRIKSPDDFILEPGLRDWSSLTAIYEEQDSWSEISKTKLTSQVKANTWNYIDDSFGFHQMTALSEEVLSLHIYRKLVI